MKNRKVLIGICGVILVVVLVIVLVTTAKKEEKKEETEAEPAAETISETEQITEETQTETVLSFEEETDLAETASADEPTEAENDAVEVEQLLISFAKAYLNGDEGWVRQLLADSYQEEVTVRKSDKDAIEVQIKGLENINEWATGDSCIASIQYLDSPESDSYEYLSLELVKQDGEWKVSFYGVEK